MKKKNKKIILYSVFSLSLIALASVGFSSWIIDGSVSDEINNITVNVGGVQNKTIVATVLDSDESADYTISFDNVSNGSSASNGDEKVEDLTFTIVYELSSTRAINDGNFKVNVSIDSTSKTSYQGLSNPTQYVDTTCISDYSFNLPSASGSVEENNTNIETTITYQENNTKAKVFSTYSFKWGSAFNNGNPGNYTGKDLVTKLESFVALAKKLPVINITIAPSFIGQGI